MPQFNMIRSEGHILLDNYGEYYVIDTGSPISFSFEPNRTLIIRGREYELGCGISEVDRKDIEELVQLPVSGFIGMDILTDIGRITFSWEMNTIDFEETESENNTVCIPIVSGGIFISADITVNGSEIPMLLDTGARIDYLDQEYLNCNNPGHIATDFNPMLGEMRVTGYETTYTIDGRDYTEIVYRQPDELSLMLKMFGVCGIIGMNVFSKAGKSTTIDLENDVLEIVR